MAESELLAGLRSELHCELVGHLLPYWIRNSIDEPHGGFVGRITQDGRIVRDAEKGAVLNARILWTFAAAYRLLGDDHYRRMADRARDYILAHFWDPDHEGVYWSVDFQGQPLDTRKHVYVQAFALYGFSEHHRATGDADSLDRSVRLFRLIEAHSHDPARGGYFEAYSRDWKPLDDARLSDKDLNAPRSMNTHLHVLEAYTNLYRVWPDPSLGNRLRELIDLFLTTIIDRDTGHLHLFFDTDWRPVAGEVSFGHDIEASWLLLEAANVLADPALRSRVRSAALAVADITRREGQDGDGGLFNEVRGDGHLDADKHWWPQAEAIVGFVNAYQESGEAEYLQAAAGAWDFTMRHVVDHSGGEWFGRVARDGVPYEGEDKVGFWKCPYHNARACLEIMDRTEHVEA